MRRVLSTLGVSLAALTLAAEASAVLPMDGGINPDGDSVEVSADHAEKVEEKTETPGKTETDTKTITETKEKVVPSTSDGSSGKSAAIPTTGEQASSSGGGSAPKAVPLTAAQKAVITNNTWREDSFGTPIFGGCGDSDFQGVAAACEEPEEAAPAAPAVAPAAQTRTDTTTRTVTTTRQRPPRVRVSRDEVRKKAVDKITPTAPELGASPCLASSNGCTGTVGVPVWLWAENGGELPSDTASATAGPYTVRATGKVKQVKWSLGDGQETVCTGAGTVFNPDTHGWSAPDCGFETGWKKAGNYTLTATYVWEVSWSGDVNGSTTRELSASEDITVREIQSVVDGHES